MLGEQLRLPRGMWGDSNTTQGWGAPSTASPGPDGLLGWGNNILLRRVLPLYHLHQRVKVLGKGPLSSSSSSPLPFPGQRGGVCVCAVLCPLHPHGMFSLAP